MWNSLIELVRATIFAGSHLFGGSIGASIIFVSAVLRLALTPLVLYAARRAREQQGLLAALKPEIDRLQQRYRANPARLFQEIRTLHRERGVKTSPVALAATMVQVPLVSALFTAVRRGLGHRIRFLWIADLSHVDVLLVVGISALAGMVAAAAPTPAPAAANKTLALTAVGLTALFLFSASSAVALSVGAGSAVSLLQNWILRRDLARVPAKV